MAYIQVALVGDNMELIAKAARELGADRVILVGGPDQRATADKTAAALEALGFATEWRPIEGDMLVASIRVMQKIAHDFEGRRHDILVNLAAGSRGMTCAALSGCFVAGLKAIDNDAGKIVFLPVLRFSYDEVVSDAKVQILRTLDGMGGEAPRLADLAKGSGLQDSLVSYHIRGGRDGRGLTELGLVEIDRGTRGALTIRITPMGRLMARGLGP